MRILFVAATKTEISPLIAKLNLVDGDEYSYNGHQIDVLITGIGMTATAYQLGKYLALNKFDLVINLGIAGSFDRNINIGDVVNVSTDRLYELGVEDDDVFVNIFAAGLVDKDDFPFSNGRLINNTVPLKTISELPNVNSITVNTVHGNALSIKKAIERANPQIESMEGAAFMHVCLMEKMPFFQIRAISNYVEKRNKNAWNIPLAIKTLNAKALQIISTI